jgi:hypothetical protein
MRKVELRRIIREEISKLHENNMSGAIYHFTRYRFLESILDSDTLKLTDGRYGRDKEFQRGKSYFGSFTTGKAGHVGFPLRYKMRIRIAFDARKLGANHKLVGVDYYGDYTFKSAEHKMRKDENEIRLISNKVSIPNVSKYIKYIDVAVNEDIYENDEDTLNKLYLLAQKRGIEIRYSYNKDWNLGRNYENHYRIFVPSYYND